MTDSIMEFPPKNEECKLILSPRENEIEKEIKTLVKYENPEMSQKRNKALIKIQKAFKKNNVDVRDYYIWHTSVHSTPPEDIVEFDTPDHDIEK